MIANSGYVHNMALLGIESHPPGARPLHWSLQVTLECLLVRHGSSGAVEYAIICEEAHLRGNNTREVVYIKKKEQGSQH